MVDSPEATNSNKSSGPSTVTVTGGGGFLGSRIVEVLSESVDRVIALDANRTPRSEKLSELENVDFRTIDLRDIDAVEPALAESDAVIHLAAVRTQASRSRPKDAHDINVGCLYDLLTLSQKHDVERFIFSSSNTVYGSYQDPETQPFREDTPWVPHGINMYAATKLAGEAYLEAFAEMGGPDYLSLRIGPVYGPRITADSTSALLLKVLASLDSGERPSVSWSPDSVLALVYVDDVARAAVAALTATESRCAVNVVGAPVTARDAFSKLVELYGHDPALLDFTSERKRYQHVSQDRMKEVLGIESTRIDQGFDQFIAWYRETR